MKRYLFGVIFVTVAAMVVLPGCGQGGERVQVKSRANDVSVSLRLPEGWALEGAAMEEMAVFSESENPENRGAVNVWPAEGKELTAWVDEQISMSQKMAAAGRMLGAAMERLAGAEVGSQAEQAFEHKTVSRSAKKVGKWEALEIVADAGGKKSVSLFVKKGDAICEASLYSVPEGWSANEAVFRKALASLRVR